MGFISTIKSLLNNDVTSHSDKQVEPKPAKKAASQDGPMDGILAKTSMERHATILVITAEHTGEALTKWYNSTIEDAVGVGKMVTLDDWILRIPPKRSLAGGWPLLPRNIGKSRTYNLDFFHCYQKNIVIIRRIIL